MDRAKAFAPALLALKGSQGAISYGMQAAWHELLERKPTRAPWSDGIARDFYSGAVTRQAMDETLDAARERLATR